jgi:leucyl/phenylalanyl-tRNA---protein transferase
VSFESSNYNIDQVISAYQGGSFPMAEKGVLGFYTCDPRSVFFFDSFHIPKRLKRIYNQKIFQIKVDTVFNDVVEHCRKDRPEWISNELSQIYSELYFLGKAHSFEAWENDNLVGGVFGTCFGSAFLAESMFHLTKNASNCCLIYMMEWLKEKSFHFCDIQYANDHTARFNPVDVPLRQFNLMLKEANKS